MFFLFYGTRAKGAGTQERSHIHTGKQPTQVGKKPAYARRKPAQVGKEPAQGGRGDVPRFQTLGNQGRSVAPYHSGK